MSEKIALTEKRLKDLQPVPGKQLEVWDTALAHFGVRVSPGGTKTFTVVRRVLGKVVRVMIGRSPEVPLIKAREEAEELLIKMRKGINPNFETQSQRAAANDTRLLLPILLEKYLADGGKYGRLKDSTKSAYWSMFKRLEPIHNRKVDDITASAVTDLQRRINTINGPSAANGSMRLLRSLISFSQKMYDKPEKNPMKGITWYKENPRREALPPEDTAGFLQALVKIKGNNAADLLNLILFTGMRKSEAMGLTWGNVDLVKGSLRIENTKNGNPLGIPLSKYVINLLKERKEYSNSKWIFPSNSRSGHATNTHQFVRELKGQGVTIYPHLLRKTFTTVGALLVPHVCVELLTGHIPQDITGKFYTFPSIEELRPHTETITRELLRRAGIVNYQP